MYSDLKPNYLHTVHLSVDGYLTRSVEVYPLLLVVISARDSYSLILLAISAYNSLAITGRSAKC